LAKYAAIAQDRIS